MVCTTLRVQKQMQLSPESWHGLGCGHHGGRCNRHHPDHHNSRHSVGASGCTCQSSTDQGSSSTCDDVRMQRSLPTLQCDALTDMKCRRLAMAEDAE